MADKKNSHSGNSSLQAKEIILGICAGIAAFKVPELIRSLKSHKANVTCILTENAAKFITPLTLQTISANQVYKEMFETYEWDVEHISLAQKADIIVIVPATADTIAKLACGRAEDLLSSVVLAAQSPVLVCPAMNERMWFHQATQNNVHRLKEYGYHIVPPEKGELACGITGTGRLADLEKIRQAIEKILRESKRVRE